MAKARHTAPASSTELPKCPSGILGLDEITRGGLPRGRSTLLCGGAGTGKTLFTMEFLTKGAREYGEPGVFIAFEERPDDLIQNTASLGFDIGSLIASKKLLIEHVVITPADSYESGDYNLDGLFIRLGLAIDTVGAKRVVLDTTDILFSSLTNLAVLRSELRRLIEWLKERGVTSIITAERDDNTMTRHGIEEYVSDCVILLDQRVKDQIATRRLRISKYRGSLHAMNEYPFVIDEGGFVVLTIPEIPLNYIAPTTLVSTGVPMLDAMLAGKGVYRGSTILISGGAGTGKSSLGGQFVEATARRGKRCIYFAFEETPAQIMRNMGSIGLDLKKWEERGLLRFFAVRPSSHGLELNLSSVERIVDEFKPEVVALDPISSFASTGSIVDAHAVLTKIVDMMKSRAITTMLISLTGGGESLEATSTGVSSLIDTWILLSNFERGGERNRSLTVLKSRGINHSNQVREIVLTDHGIVLEDIYVGPDGILVGSARQAQLVQDRIEEEDIRLKIEQKKAVLAGKRAVVLARIAELEANDAVATHELEQSIAQDAKRLSTRQSGRAELAKERQTLRSTRRHRTGGGS